MNKTSILFSTLLLIGISEISSAQKVVVIPLFEEGGANWLGPWGSGISYQPAEVVESEGSSYIATAVHVSASENQPPNSDYWDLVAAKGEPEPFDPSRFAIRKTNCVNSGYVNEWDGVMNAKCVGQKVMEGMFSIHDNGRDDRRFQFYCCDLELVELPQ